MALTVVKSMDVSDFWECWQHIKALVELEYEAVRTDLGGAYDLELKLIWDCAEAEDGSVDMGMAEDARVADRAVTRGYCFDCDDVVDMAYSPWWFVTTYKDTPRTCLTCGGHDVGFLDRVSLRLLERIKGGVDE
ncbi:MAG: hypothetical protein H8D78_00835 [Chloroflexi bacterium]|nr:hypothetical protein [Chloroflexota bacterium]